MSMKSACPPVVIERGEGIVGADGLPPGRRPNLIVPGQLDFSRVELLGTIGKRVLGAAIG